MRRNKESSPQLVDRKDSIQDKLLLGRNERWKDETGTIAEHQGWIDVNRLREEMSMPITNYTKDKDNAMAMVVENSIKHQIQWISVLTSFKGQSIFFFKNSNSFDLFIKHKTINYEGT